MAGQESTGYAHLMSGSNRETGGVLPRHFCPSIRMRNMLVATKIIAVQIYLYIIRNN